MNSNSLKIYIKQIHDFEPLSENEEKKLFYRLKKKGKKAEAARRRLIETNLPIVITLAKKYYYPALRMEFVNFIGEGNIGLIKAVEKYDPDKGYKFSTYASWWIEKYFQESILKSRSVIQLPEKKLSDLKKIEESASKLLQKTGSTPSYEDVADKIDMSISKVRDTVISALKMKYVKSLDYFIDAEENKTLKDVISNDEDIIEDIIKKISINNQLRQLFESLNEKERSVLNLRFGLGGRVNHTYKEIASKLNVSPTRARDIQNVAIRKLRHVFKEGKVKTGE